MSDEALWALGRGTGVTALLLLTLSIVLGVAARSGRPVVGLPRFALSSLHRWVALGATLLIALHITTMVIDPYAQIRLVDVVVPFRAGYAPIWVGLGTLALDLLVVVVATALLRHLMSPRTFRVIHLATHALWPVAFAHALGSGTDVGHVWMIAVCVICALTVGAAVTARFLVPGEFDRTRRIARDDVLVGTP
ncbi:ferric reductase-like transmembrane domain-containing protein [Williamsia deligens]|uniref:Ferric reductase-like transmembrane domain-containing protein n=1 Tax=Williamsia deligens TaxID=321325 RepID=A0ABW3G6F5_9NOCA|nr:ferric reductase-like transmembrane domain-containing protein [Williamsia deligens]MCP2193577.1 sulfoxide reductase heme-binding subunit YedZ [Williamsia deligens]